MQQLPKVLLVEDDRSIAGALAHALKSAYEVDIASTGKLAFYKTDIEAYDAILLDLNLPDIGGLQVCQELRIKGVHAPILILSGETNILTKIALLDSGANDYLTKPFSLGELKARLRSLIRNAPLTAAPAQRLIVGDIILDRQNHQVQYKGHQVTLRRKEFSLLECLMENAGIVISREKLARHGWQSQGGPWTNTVDVHINHLRDKLDRRFGTRLIHTVHGIGYKFEIMAAALLESD